MEGGWWGHSVQVRGGQREPSGPGEGMPVSHTKKCHATNKKVLIESLQRKKYPVVLLVNKAPFLFFSINSSSLQKEKL